MGHLLEPRPDHHPAHVADRAHHLEFLVDHHGELLGLLAVAEEGQQALGGRALGGVAVGAADGIHHDGPAGHPHMHLGAGTDQRPVPGMDDERPVRAPLAGQQPPEQGQRVRPAEARDLAAEGPPDDEVRTLAPADLVLDDPPYRPRVLRVGHVERSVLDPHRVGGQRVQRRVERQCVRLVRDQHGQGCAVVADVEAALGDLPERHEGEDGLFADGDVREPVGLPHAADQHLDGVVVVAGRAPAQQGEGRAVVAEESLDDRVRGGVRCHLRCSFHWCQLGGTAPDMRKAAPRAASASVCTRDQWAAG